jgi:integrase
MPRPLGTGLHVKRVKRADGTIREYFSNRYTGQTLGTDRAVAEARMREWIAAQVPTRPIGRASLDALISDYLRTDDYRNLKPRTQEIYRLYLDQLRTRFGVMPVNMIGIEWVERLKLDLQDQPGKCNQTLAVLRITLGWGMRLGYCRSNPAKAVSKAQLPARTTIWSSAQIEAFLGGARGSLQLAMALLLYTAQRPSDVLEMTKGRISERDGRLYIALRQGKTNELLDVPVHAKLEPLLRERLADASGGLLLVPSPRGHLWSRRNFSRAWDAACKKAELSGVQRRDLRRTAVVLMAEAGLTVGQIAAITGHRIETTAAILNVYLPRRTEVALAGMEAWERTPPAALSKVVALAAERDRRRK